MGNNDLFVFATGPFVGALVNAFDPRKLTVAGGMLSATASTLAASSSSIEQLASWFALSSMFK